MRALILLPAAVLAACSASSGASQSSGERRSYEVASFHGVELAGRDTVIVTVGGAPSVRAEGPAKLLDQLEVKVQNGILVIRERSHWGWNVSTGNEHATVYVTAPALSAATLGGSGDIRIDTVAGGTFTGSVAGSGNLEVGNMRVDAADFSNAGSGGIKVTGAAGTARLSLVGSGNIDAGALKTVSADVSIMGSGDASVHASDAAKISIMGSGDATVHGGAKCRVVKLGSGDAHCTG